MIFDDPAALLARLDHDKPDWRLVTVDGWLCAGKSHLGRELSLHGELWSVDLDCFIARRIDAYVASLALDSLSAAIQASPTRIVLVGVCVRDVIGGLGIEADSHIYVKRMASWGWADEDEAIGDGVQQISRAAGCSAPLREEVHRYHLDFQPHLCADYEFQWREQ